MLEDEKLETAEVTAEESKETFLTMGSLRHRDGGRGGVKDFYTPQEAKRFTRGDFDRNPGLFQAVKASMAKWK